MTGQNIIHPLSIGNVKLVNNLVLGPMAGVTDPPFRRLCKQQGVGLVCMEMVSAKAIFYKNKKTSALLKVYPDEKPVSLQLFGSDPDCISAMTEKLTDSGTPFDIIDINMGCPVPKIVKNGEGSALMRKPQLVAKIVSKTVSASRVPVTVKIRSGFDSDSINAVEIAQICEASGAAAVAVHARTREQYYSGNADWSVIAEVKSKLSIPVIGNGDITCFGDVQKMYEQTGCDGFMIARGARGNPWIFSEILSEAAGEVVEHPSVEQIKEMILKHANMLCTEKGEYIAVREMRKHAAWYIAGFPGASTLRKQINDTESIDEIKSILEGQ